MNIFFPSCNFTKANNVIAKKVREYFKDRMNTAGCCLYDQNVYDLNDVGYVLCQACREHLEEKINIKSIYEYIDEDQSFVFPNYQHQKMYMVDCFRDRKHSEVHIATRNLLTKMNIDIIEIELNKENSNYCGTLHYQTSNPQLNELLKQYPDTKISRLPEDIQIMLMQDYVKQFDLDYPIIVDCNRCKKGILMGGKNAVHLVELLFNEKS